MVWQILTYLFAAMYVIAQITTSITRSKMAVLQAELDILRAIGAPKPARSRKKSASPSGLIQDARA